MKRKILGLIGIIWGGAILLSTLLKGGPEGEGAYAAGQASGLIFGVILFAAGLFYLFKPKRKTEVRRTH